MATTDVNGIVLYEDTDSVSPLHTLLNLGMTSVSNALANGERIYPAGSTTAMNNLATARNPTASKPLFVYRHDLKVIYINYGSGFHPYIKPTLSGYATFPSASAVTHEKGITFPAGFFNGPPIVTATSVHSTLRTTLLASVWDVTATSAKIIVTNTNGATFPINDSKVAWIATQE